MSALVLLLSVLATGPQSASAVLQTATATSHVEVSPDYQLGPGDLISIRVSGVREFDQSTRVSNSGRVRVPYVGVMFVAGTTTVQVERDVARLIKEHELVAEPMVRVQVEEYRARPAYVVGEVMTPGQFVITGEMYVLDLISKAGGLLVGAADVGYLYRRGSQLPSVQARIVSETEAAAPVPAPATKTDGPQGGAARTPAAPVEAGEPIAINFEELKSGARPELNVRLSGGDVLYVPRTRQQNIYVIGDVTVPGAYTLPRRGRLSAAQAVIYAGGPLKTASMKKGFLMRHDRNGVRQAMPVNFAAIIEGKQADIPVQADDIIYIPNSTVKTMKIGLLDLIPTIIQQWLIF